MGEWISVEAELPQPITGVLVTDGINIWTARCFWPSDVKGKPFWVSHGCTGWELEDEFGTPTHWMPLPEPPKRKP